MCANAPAPAVSASVATRTGRAWGIESVRDVDAADPDEPLRDKFSLDAAVAILDNATLTWQRDRKCFACHSNYAFLETRPLVS